LKDNMARSTSDPLWYKDAILYELHVRAYKDGVGDGMGDFTGLASKLDYLQDLGITAIWLLPFYPSPLRDDGYDTADYTDVHPSYGTMRDFRHFLKEAHRRGLRVITELVLNHTSDQHPWFQKARRAKPGSAARNFYVWSDSPEKYAGTRIIFQDFEHSNWTWDHEAKAYYWHRFYSHQPDLNWDNPTVRKTMLSVLDFWFDDVGVDGLRLDAVPYLFEREGTNNENLPETHAALKEIRRHIDARYPDKMLLAEANQWPEDAVAYFGSGKGDECHTAFHFPLMPRMFMGIRTEDRYPIVDMLEQTPAIPDNCQWVLFLRNHDELTLEMVTDEERDYMYRVYAQDQQARINVGIRRRLAPLLGNSRRKIELMNCLLLSLPGTPVIYYGDEIGMGDNFYLGDRNGVRTPMQWSPDRNAGFSRANSQKLYSPVIIDPEYHYEAVNVEVQQDNPQSLLWWTKRVLSVRKQSLAFGRGSLEFLYPENNRVLAYLRAYEGERVLVVANLSRFPQHVDLNLSAFKGQTPVEMFGRNAFPVITEAPYPLSLGPHGFYWFSLESPAVGAAAPTATLPVVAFAGRLADLVSDEGRNALDAALPAILRTRPWFRGGGRTIQGAEVVESVEVRDHSCLSFVRVEYTEGEAETYVVPMAVASGAQLDALSAQTPQALLARVEGDDGPAGALYDPLWDRVFCEALLGFMVRKPPRGAGGQLSGWSEREIRRPRDPHLGNSANVTVVDQTNTSVIFGSRFILRLLRILEPGIHPDLEMSEFLTAKAKFAHTPPLLGALEYRERRGTPVAVALLHGFIPHESDAWRYTIDELGRYFERVVSGPAGTTAPPAPTGTLVELAAGPIPVQAQEMIGSYIQSATRMGQRTAEMHLALVSRPGDAAFAPEAFTELYQRSLVQSMRTLSRQVLQRLKRRLRALPEDARADAQKLLTLESELLKKARAVHVGRFTGMRTRYHGMLHLGQMLYTGKDFVILMSEGEAMRSAADRRVKRSPLRDVAGMLRSLHYAAAHEVSTGGSTSSVRREDLPVLEPWADFWRTWVSVAFLKGYLETAAGARFLPRKPEDLRTELDAALLEKALHEVGFEIDSRPEWARIPIRGILEIVSQ
jgi:maltose alpha-D-glucosyltransferase/alpha-amylase